MQRTLVVLIVLVLAAIGGALWWLSRGQASVPPDTGRVASTEPTGGAAAQSVAMASSRDEALRSTTREAVASLSARVLDDPEITAALTGFKGRVVSHKKQPVPDAGVRIYRGAMDVVLQEAVDLFAEEPTLVPQYVAGETRTGTDGTFVISGVWPRAFYIMFAGIGTDAPMHQILSHTPSPGEVVDLGDIVLPDAGVIVGTVLDDSGDPLPGALVRAVDLPGALAAFFPVERFDPEGAVLIRQPKSPIKVVEMPAWVRTAFEHLPIPSTRSDSEGKFRLVGVAPGSNLLATTAPEHLSDVKPSVLVRAGQVKDVGNVKLKHGEELTGRVLDSAGKPIAGAEVLAGSTLSQVPFDLARRLDSSDADGRFQGHGFSAGKVTVAARRGRAHAWVLAEPQPILGEVTVTLPSTHAVAVTVTLADGAPAKQARLKLLSGDAGDGGAEMAVLGFVPPVDLRDRLTPAGEGQWRIENLAAGEYSLVADAPGHATAFQAFDIADADASVALQLTGKKDFAVRVLSREDKPIRNAAIYAQAHGKALFHMPVHCGRTNADGRLVVDKLLADTLRISADHPRWGVVHGEAKLGEELVLYMEPPGSLRGVLTENGRPPELGKFTVVVTQEGGDGPRGPIEQVPMLVTARPDGSFGVLALQPGSYRVAVIKSLDALRSPGSLVMLSQSMFMQDEVPSAEARVHSGETAEVRLDAGVKALEGPTGHLFGTVTIDGRLASGNTVACGGEGRRFQTNVDESGRFDLGQVPAAKALQVRVLATGDSMVFGADGASLWAGTVTLAVAEERELAITVATSSVSGTCFLADGSVAAGAFVQARGRPKGAEEGHGQLWLGASTDQQGRFHFAQVAEGTWSFDVRTMGERTGRGRLEGIAVVAGIPLDSLRIEVQKGITVKGRVDVARFGDKKPQGCWISFHGMPADGGDGVGEWADAAGFDMADGSFTTDDLAPGKYRVRVHAHFGEEEQGEEREYRSDDIEVPPQGLDDLRLRVGEVVSRG